MTYWNHEGLHEHRVEALHRIIDEVFDFDNRVMPQARTKHAKLESLRKGKNAYYRFFNDGDYPRTFSRALTYWEPIRDQIEVLINQRVDAAWEESVANGYVKESE